MTSDDIIRMAYEASDGVLSYDAEGRWILSEQEVIQLAALVAAAEREACLEAVKRAKEHQIIWYPKGSTINANDIGEIYAFQHERCAAAIRARGE
jgi:hypothetical protein